MYTSVVNIFLHIYFQGEYDANKVNNRSISLFQKHHGRYENGELEPPCSNLSTKFSTKKKKLKHYY